MNVNECGRVFKEHSIDIGLKITPSYLHVQNVIEKTTSSSFQLLFANSGHFRLFAEKKTDQQRCPRQSNSSNYGSMNLIESI